MLFTANKQKNKNVQDDMMSDWKDATLTGLEPGHFVYNVVYSSESCEVWIIKLSALQKM